MAYGLNIYDSDGNLTLSPNDSGLQVIYSTDYVALTRVTITSIDSVNERVNVSYDSGFYKMTGYGASEHTAYNAALDEPNAFGFTLTVRNPIDVSTLMPVSVRLYPTNSRHTVWEAVSGDVGLLTIGNSYLFAKDNFGTEERFNIDTPTPSSWDSVTLPQIRTGVTLTEDYNYLLINNTRGKLSPLLTQMDSGRWRLVYQQAQATDLSNVGGVDLVEATSSIPDAMANGQLVDRYGYAVPIFTIKMLGD